MESWQENQAQRVPIMPWPVEFGQAQMMEALEFSEGIIFVRVNPQMLGLTRSVLLFYTSSARVLK